MRNQNVSHDRTYSGFTIVELLIVIVVIAILASISIVAYASIQKKATNTSIVQGVQSYMGLLRASYTANGTVVVTRVLDDYAICLGTTEQYPAIDGMDEGQCAHRSHTSAELNDILNPIGRASLKTYETDYFRGIQYGFDVTKGDGALIWYELFGEDADCGIPTAVADPEDGFTMCMVNVRDVIGGDPVDFTR